MEFARRAAPQKIAKKARFMKSSRIREKSPDLRYFADVTCVFLDRIVKASRDGTLRPVHVQELGLRHVTSRRAPNCFISIVTPDVRLQCDADKRDETCGRLGSPDRDIGIRHLARRDVLGHLDGAANVIGDKRK